MGSNSRRKKKDYLAATGTDAGAGARKVAPRKYHAPKPPARSWLWVEADGPAG